MPRREHIKTELSYIDWLKSQGCVFYAPLDQENAYKDLITGINGVKTSRGTITWNNNETSYLFHANNTYCSIIWSNINGFVGSSAPWAMTLLFRVKIQSTGEWDSMLGIGGDSVSGSYYANNNNCTINQWIRNYNIRTSQTNTWFDLATVYHSDGTSSNYKNGSYATAGNAFNTGAEIPIVQTNVCIIAANAYFYIKNAMIFDRELDLTMIREIQGYE